MRTPEEILEDAKLRVDLQQFIIELLPDALCVVDNDGNIIFVNHAMELMFGYHRNEMLGNKVEMFLPIEKREIHVRHRMDYNDDRRTRIMGSGLNLLAKSKHGRDISVEIMLAPIVLENGVFIISVIRRKSNREVSGGVSS